jgi:hypothetical protein
METTRDMEQTVLVIRLKPDWKKAIDALNGNLQCKKRRHGSRQPGEAADPIGQFSYLYFFAKEVENGGKKEGRFKWAQSMWEQFSRQMPN